MYPYHKIPCIPTMYPYHKIPCILTMYPYHVSLRCILTIRYHVSLRCIFTIRSIHTKYSYEVFIRSIHRLDIVMLKITANLMFPLLHYSSLYLLPLILIMPSFLHSLIISFSYIPICYYVHALHPLVSYPSLLMMSPSNLLSLHYDISTACPNHCSMNRNLPIYFHLRLNP
jgi:hypothetical protein